MLKGFVASAAMICAMALSVPAQAGGRPIPMMEIIDSPVVWANGTPVDIGVVQRAILFALVAKDWKAQQVEPGLIHAVLRRDDWVAEIDIPYTATSYSIKYANSVNLDYNAQKHVIHRNFNKWLTNLRQIIDAETVRADVK